MRNIEAINLSFRYPDSEVIFDQLSFSLDSPDNTGKVIAVLGQSGSGKSTLLRLLAGLEQPLSGSLQIHPPLERPPVYLFQDAVLLTQYSRLENAKYRGMTGTSRHHFNESSFLSLSDAMLLSDGFLENKRPMTPVSGGQRQRLALLRDLSIEPELLLLDEPCTGLDPQVKTEFLRVLRSIVQQRPMLVFYVTHHLSEAEMVADDVLYIEKHGVNSDLSRITITPLKYFLETPPTLESALFNGQPTNSILPLSKGNEEHWNISKKLNLNQLSDKETLAVISPLAVFPCEKEGIYAPEVSFTDCYAFHQIPNCDFFICRGNKAFERASHIKVSGEAFLCKSQTDLIRVNIETVTDGEKVWLKIK